MNTQRVLRRTTRDVRLVMRASIRMFSLVGLVVAIASIVASCSHDTGPPAGPAATDSAVESPLPIAVQPRGVAPYAVHLSFASKPAADVSVRWALGGQNFEGNVADAVVDQPGLVPVQVVLSRGVAQRSRTTWIRGLRQHELARATVGAFGDTLPLAALQALSSGGSFMVPPAALAAPVEISVHELDGNLQRPEGGLGLSRLTLEFGPRGTKFLEPPTLTLPLSAVAPDACGMPKATLRAYLMDAPGQPSEEVAVSLDCEAQTVSVPVPHFSLLGFLFDEYCETDLTLANGKGKIGGTLCWLWDSKAKKIVEHATKWYDVVALGLPIASDLAGLSEQERPKVFQVPMWQLDAGFYGDITLDDYLFSEHIHYQAWQAIKDYDFKQPSTHDNLTAALHILGATASQSYVASVRRYWQFGFAIAKKLVPAGQFGPVMTMFETYGDAFVNMFERIQQLGIGAQYAWYVECVESGSAKWTPDSGGTLGTLEADGAPCTRESDLGWLENVLHPTAGFSSQADVDHLFRTFEALRMLAKVPEEEWQARLDAQIRLVESALALHQVGSPQELCGDGAVQSWEACDAGAFLSTSCAAYHGSNSWLGALSCHQDCLGLDDSMCCQDQVACTTTNPCKVGKTNCLSISVDTCEEMGNAPNGLPCEGGYCSNGACVASMPPTAPMTVEIPATAMVGVPATVRIVAGTDPDGGDVVVECASPGSSCLPAKPCSTPGPIAAESEVEMSLTWNSPGTLPLLCRTLDDEAVSSGFLIATVDVFDGTGGEGGVGGSGGDGGMGGGGGMGGSGGIGGSFGAGGPVVQIAAGAGHTCARLEQGSVRCWGPGSAGRLGYGNTSNIGDDETPASAGDVNVGGTVVQIAAGGGHSCALLDTGSVRCWGWNNRGQLGYGNTSNIGDDETPASAGDVDVGGTVAQIAAGYTHTCALLTTGNVRCWGGALFGQLGYGNMNDIGDDETPASAGDVNLGGTVAQIAAGTDHTCALLMAGTVRCWGDATAGCLGYGNINDIGDNETPASAGNVNVGGTVTQVAAGFHQTCGLLTTGTLRCWGTANWGTLGYGNTNSIGDDETPAAAGDVNVGGAVAQVAAGGYHTCTVLTTGAVRCWGEGLYGKLGYGNITNIGDDELPASAGDVNAGGDVTQIVNGYDHTCALLTTGAVRCWGQGLYGKLGYGNTTNLGDQVGEMPPPDVPWL